MFTIEVEVPQNVSKSFDVANSNIRNCNAGRGAVCWVDWPTYDSSHPIS